MSLFSSIDTPFTFQVYTKMNYSKTTKFSYKIRFVPCMKKMLATHLKSQFTLEFRKERLEGSKRLRGLRRLLSLKKRKMLSGIHSNWKVDTNQNLKIYKIKNIIYSIKIDFYTIYNVFRFPWYFSSFATQKVGKLSERSFVYFSLFDHPWRER